MNKADIIRINPNLLSVSELKEVELLLTNELSNVRNGIINDSFAGYELKDLEEKLSSKLLKVQNTITAKRIRG